MDNNNDKNRVSVFHSAKNSRPAGTQDLIEIYNDISTALYEEEISIYRQLVAEYKILLAEGKSEDARVKKEESDVYKKSLPAFTAAAVFTNNRQQDAEHIHHYTGAIVMDWDHVNDVNDLFSKIIKDKYVRLAFISPGGEGIKAWVQTDNADWKKHSVVFKQVNNYLKNLLGGIESDESCKDVTRLTFFSSCSIAHYNGQSEIFKIKTESRIYNIEDAQTLPIKVGNSMEERYHESKMFAESKVPFKNPQRNRFIHLLSCETNRRGIPLETVLPLMISDYEEDGFWQKEISDTCTAAYHRNAEEHGKFLIELPTSKLPSDKEWINDRELANMPMPDRVWLWEDLIRRVGFTLIASPPGIGKSTLCRQIGIHIVYKMSSVIGKMLYPEFNRAIFVSWEDDWLAVKESFDQQIRALGITPSGDFQFYFPHTNNAQQVLANLEEKIKAMNGVDVIFIDCWNALYGGTGKETTNTLGQRSLVDVIEDWCQKMQVCVIAIHHPIKSNYFEEPDMRSLSGGGGLIERCRAILALNELKSENADCIYLTVTKGNLIKPIYRRQYIEIAREEGTFIYRATGRIIPKGGSTFGMTREVKKLDNMEKRKKTISEIFTVNGNLQHGKFCELYKESTGLSLVSGSRHLAEMVKEGIIVHDEMAGVYSLKETKVELAPIEMDEICPF